MKPILLSDVYFGFDKLSQRCLSLSKAICADTGFSALPGKFCFQSVFSIELFLSFPQKEIRNTILNILARIRMYYPDEVDDFLEINDFEDSEGAQVKSRTPQENIGDMIILRGAAFAVDALLLEFPEMRSIVQWIFLRSLDSKNPNQWLSLVLMRIINFVYGEEVFELEGTQN